MGGLGRTQDGGWLCTPDGSEITRGLASHVIYPDGKKYPLLDYIKEQTGRDLSEFFTYSYKPSDDAEPVEKTDIGVVHFSGDGKTMTSCAVNMDRTTYRRNAYLRFDKSPLAIPLGVDPVELQPNGLSILWQGDALLFSEPMYHSRFFSEATHKRQARHRRGHYNNASALSLHIGLVVRFADKTNKSRKESTAM